MTDGMSEDRTTMMINRINNVFIESRDCKQAMAKEAIRPWGTDSQ